MRKEGFRTLLKEIRVKGIYGGGGSTSPEKSTTFRKEGLKSHELGRRKKAV